MQERRNDDSGLDRGSLPLASTLTLETQAAGKSSRRSQRGKPVRTPAPEREQTPPAPSLSDSERYRQISLCAYFRAERRGFEPGHMWDDWLAAEREVAEREGGGQRR
ncbi:MAG: DUF2934 domain-containing protein [Terriglobales bacterium]